MSPHNKTSKTLAWHQHIVNRQGGPAFSFPKPWALPIACAWLLHFIHGTLYPNHNFTAVISLVLFVAVLINRNWATWASIIAAHVLGIGYFLEFFSREILPIRNALHFTASAFSVVGLLFVWYGIGKQRIT